MPQERSLPVRLALPIALISLPLLFLLLLGVYFLRQDKLLVQTDAREKARQLGLNLMAQFDAARVRFLTPAFFTNTNIWDPNELFFQIGPGPRILFPAPIQSGSSSNEFVVLTPAQSNLWIQAQTAEFIERDLSKAIALWRSLARTNLDVPARDIALFNEAVLLAKSGSTNDARPLFQLLEKLPPSERLPGGLPLSHLAVLKLLALDPAADPQSAAWRFIREPTPFSAFLLSKIRLNNSNKLQSAWNQYNRARQLGRDYLDSHPPNSVTNLIVLSGGTNWWLFQDGSNVLARSESATLALYSNLLAQTPIPEYLTVALCADNRLLDGKPSDKLSRPLATISNSGPGSAARERLDVFLANPALLYARQRQRALWLGALLAISTIVAIIGLVYTTRSQLKQQRLNLLKSNFLSSVSHELRAPLASMRLMSESLQSGRVHDLEKQREYFHFLVQECRRLAVLVENVLDFSRIEQNRKFYEFESVDLREHHPFRLENRRARGPGIPRHARFRAPARRAAVYRARRSPRPPAGALESP
jgi:hypothetical protein